MASYVYNSTPGHVCASRCSKHRGKQESTRRESTRSKRRRKEEGRKKGGRIGQESNDFFEAK